MRIQGQSLFNKKVVFKGAKKDYDEKGHPRLNFFFPDKINKDVKLEFVQLKKNSKTGWQPVKNGYKISLPLEGANKVAIPLNSTDMQRLFAEGALGYRYVIDKEQATSLDNEQINLDSDDEYVKKEPYFFLDPGYTTNPLEKESSPEKPRYNVVFPNRSILQKNGAMQTELIDISTIGRFTNGVAVLDDVANERANKAVRTHIHKLGGNFAGIAYRLPFMKEEGIRRIVCTPFTKDTISSHKYWPQNTFLVSPDLGSLDDFKNFANECFKNDINIIYDAAMCNEGLTGNYFSHILKWGIKSPFYHWLNTNGLNNNGFALGILASDAKEHVGMKIINPLIDNKGNVADPSKPTYINFYDKRFATPQQVNDSKNLIQKYELDAARDDYSVPDFYSGTAPYFFEISPSQLLKNLKNSGLSPTTQKIEDYDKILQVAQSEFWHVSDQLNASGYYQWDGNVDLVKRNSTIGVVENNKIKTETNKDKQALLKENIFGGVYNVVDTSQQTIGYWAKLIRLTNLEYVANMLKDSTGSSARTIEDYKTKIDDLIRDNSLPSSLIQVLPNGKKADMLPSEVLKNVLQGKSHFYLNMYHDYKGKNSNYDNAIKRELMNLYFETFDCEQNLASVLSSPYISKKAFVADDVSKSRMDIKADGYKNIPQEFLDTYKQVDKLLEEDFFAIAKNILGSIQANGKQIYTQDNKLTPLGRYVLPIVMPDIFNFLLMKSFNPDEKVVLNNTETNIYYPSFNPHNYTLQACNVKNPLTPKEEALGVINKLKQGIKSIPKSDLNTLKIALNNRLKDLTEKDFMIAEAILAKTESGMGVRIDATKDVSDYDAVREGLETPDEAWKKVNDYWKLVIPALRQQNPNAYITAEITDLEKFMDNGRTFKYGSNMMAVPEFLIDCDITTEGDYSNLFSGISGMFGGSPEEGTSNPYERIGDLQRLYNDLFIGRAGYPGKVHQMPLDSLLHSYTFMENHDKPRVLDFLAKNMTLYSSDFSSPDVRARVVELLGKKENEISFDKLSPKAVAMGDRLQIALNKALDTAEIEVPRDKKTQREYIQKVLAFYISGQPTSPALSFNEDEILKDVDREAFKRAESWGVRPFDVVIPEIVEKLGFEFACDEYRLRFQTDILNNILDPAFDKYESAYKILVSLPGAPTMFTGSNLGMTGSESKSHNNFQQCRNHAPFEHIIEKENESELDKIRYAKTREIYQKTKQITQLRAKPELSALNDGVPISLGMYKASDKKTDVMGLYRYNSVGSQVITLITNAGLLNKDEFKQEGYYKNLERGIVELDEIVITDNNDFSDSNPQQGFPAGIAIDRRFYKYAATPEEEVTGFYVVKEIVDDKTNNKKLVLRYYDSEENYTNGVHSKIKIAPCDKNVVNLYSYDN